jgi:hypothetical protein
MAYQVFTNGSVLAASEINENLMNQAVIVFSSSATRAAAITAPLEGMLTWLEDVNRYEYYSGSAWTPLGSPGLELIKAQAIGTAVSSFTVTDAFSTDYENYRVIITGGQPGAAITASLRMGATATGYYGGSVRVTTASVISGEGQSNTTSYEVGVFTSGTNQPAMTIDFLSPFVATRTAFLVTSINTLASAAGGARWNSGWVNNTTSYTDFTISYSGTITGGTVYVYGYRKA